MGITRRVVLLSFISLFTDIASEMLYPVTPIYLKSIGYSILIIGLLEGVAEAVAGLSKGYFGALSDKKGKRTPFVKIGYTLSALSKPLIALSPLPVWVFFTRTVDRLGKGIRTGARDAILSEEATPQTKGRVFGFHRSMDTLGATLGPLASLVFLFYFPKSYIKLFYLALIPGIFAVTISLMLKESADNMPNKNSSISFFSFMRYFGDSSSAYRKLITGLLIFALLNSSDVFLLLKIKELGVSDSKTIGIYIFYNLIYAIFAFPLGILADRIGLKKVYIFGLLLFSVVYINIAFAGSVSFCLILFFVYGIYAAMTEGVSKAWISIITPKSEIATAIGTYSSFQSICTMIASSLAGLIWYKFGGSIMFIFTGSGVLLLTLYFKLFTKPA